MFINLNPLIKYRDYRLLFFSQMISTLGSMMTYMAIPYQVYILTKSSFLVGMLGVVQLTPILVFGLIGGSVADHMDRKKLLIYSEIIMALCALLLMVNSFRDTPSVFFIFILAGLMQVANGFHRPAMDATNQKLVQPKDYSAIAALNSLRNSLGTILGPSLGGALIAFSGARLTYFVDFVTFMVAISLIGLIQKMPSGNTSKVYHLKNIKEGLRYAISRPELVGTYVVDIVAMIFAFPTALFPALSMQWGGAKAAGILYSAMSVGSLIATLTSGWVPKVKRHGAVIIIAATIWGVGIIGLGFAQQLWLAVLCLVVAGAADMVSGLFRGTVWNETIPNQMRGRLSGIEMISYMSGPLLGNARAGWVASASNNEFAIVSGGVICVIACILCGFYLKKFWKYKSQI